MAICAITSIARARADARLRAAVDRRGRRHVVAGEHQRSVDFRHPGHRAQRHHRPAGVPHPQAVDVVLPVAILRLGLGDHLPGAAEEIEVVDVQRAEIDLQRRERILKVDPLEHARGAVDVQENLGDVGPEHRRVSLQLRLLIGLLDDGFGLFLERLRPQVAAVFDHDHVSAGPAHAAHRRRAEDGDLGVGDLARDLLPQLVGDGLVIGLRRRPLVKRLSVRNIVPKFDP